MKSNNKQRLFEIIQKIDKNFLNEAKAFGELRKLNKNLYDKTIKLEDKIGDKALNLIDDFIKKENFKINTNEEKELVYLIILDLILSYYLNKTKDNK